MRIKSKINSEIGKLESVIIHRPGSEVENMTPDNAERALYSDILNLHIASQEFSQLEGVLKKVSQTFEVGDLLSEVLKDQPVKETLLADIFTKEGLSAEIGHYFDYPPELISKFLIEGIALEKDNLTKYLNQERFLLRPLHNLFFTRDASMGFNGKTITGRMANTGRERESIIMEAIYKNHPFFDTTILNLQKPAGSIKTDLRATIEGGDFLVAREDVFVIGTGARTSSQGIDAVIENLKQDKSKSYHIIVQELPAKPESFIHLDMVFTILDVDTCMVYEPVVFGMNRFRTIHIKVEGGKVSSIKEETDVPNSLKKLGIDLKPVACGGTDDIWVQEREQWHSGANFFAFAPGKLIGYERNVHTVDELSKNGFEILKAVDVISGEINPGNYKKCLVTIEGSELARGGGGARCMTMPFSRADINP
jgi:arginine deiminase